MFNKTNLIQRFQFNPRTSERCGIAIQVSVCVCRESGKQWPPVPPAYRHRYPLNPFWGEIGFVAFTSKTRHLGAILQHDSAAILIMVVLRVFLKPEFGEKLEK